MGLAISTCNKFKDVLASNKIGNITKARIYRTYVESIFMYNSQLWTSTKQLENEIDFCQRRQMRRMFNMKWTDKVTNAQLHKTYTLKPLSHAIKKRRLGWYGHLLRLHEDTPARKALKECERKGKKPKGGQKLTWIQLVKKNPKELNLTEKPTKVISQNRNAWRNTIHCKMSKPLDGMCWRWWWWFMHIKKKNEREWLVLV